jgi:hypothetical protein
VTKPGVERVTYIGIYSTYYVIPTVGRYVKSTPLAEALAIAYVVTEALFQLISGQ